MPLGTNGQQTSTQLVNHLQQTWEDRLWLDTTEALEVGRNFRDVEVDKIANQLNIRKVLPRTVRTLAATALADTTNLTYEQSIDTAVSMTPAFIYCAQSVTKPMEVRMLNFPEYSSAIRTQFVRAMPEYVDTQCGLLGASLSQIQGSGAANFDRTLVLQSMAQLRQGAKREWGPGKVAYLKVHPKQIPYLFSIDAVMHANLRGDSSNPNVTGVLVEAWGLDIAVSGSVYSTGGAYHNMLYIPNAFAIGYNAKPQLSSVQDNGLAKVLHGYCEFGVTEVYDAYGVDIQTSTV